MLYTSSWGCVLYLVYDNQIDRINQLTRCCLLRTAWNISTLTHTLQPISDMFLHPPAASPIIQLQHKDDEPYMYEQG